MGISRVRAAGGPRWGGARTITSKLEPFRAAEVTGDRPWGRVAVSQGDGCCSWAAGRRALLQRRLRSWMGESSALSRPIADSHRRSADGAERMETAITIVSARPMLALV